MPRYEITAQALKWLCVILAERFGHTWNLLRTGTELMLKLHGAEGEIIFDRLEDCFTEPRSDFPFTLWDATAEGWLSVLALPLPAPGVARLPSPLIEKKDTRHVIHFDILGLAYWMFARIEEIGRSELDEHERFAAKSSHALKNGYIERPIVDEWLHILAQVIQRQWPGIVLRLHSFRMLVSHDVDMPSRYAFRSPASFLRAMAGDLVVRKKIFDALLAPWVRLQSKQALHPRDPYNTFDYIMDVSEHHGLTSAFYVLCGQTDVSRDADYDIDHPAIRTLLRRISQRGHEIGLHLSYGAFKDPESIEREFSRLRSTCEKEGVRQTCWGSRMHYLRWAQPVTIRALDRAGITYDTTLTYADHAGFRCGTCFEYPAFDAQDNRQLAIIIRPLIAMECTVLEKRYMGICNISESINYFNGLLGTCKSVKGVFSILWHNTEFDITKNRIVYKKLMAQ